MSINSKWICTNCGTPGIPKKLARGSLGGEAFIWTCGILLLVAGLGLFGFVVLVIAIVYSLYRLIGKKWACRACLSPSIISTSSPRGADLLSKGSIEKEAPQMVENYVTARKGTLTYRVLASRKLTETEIQKLIAEALERGEVTEPKPGETSTLVTVL